MTRIRPAPRARALARLVAVAAVAARLSAPLAAGQAAEPAAQFRGGPEHTGVYATRSPGESAALLWSFATGGPVRSTPAVAGGTVYFGSGDGNLYALDAATGRERWRFAAGGPVHGSPAVAGGLVLFAGGDRRFHAVEAATGRERWAFAFGPDLPFVHGWDYYLSSAAVAAGRVYAGSGDGNLYAFDAATGRVLWKLPTQGRVRSSPAVANGAVYVGSMDGRLYAADAASGRPLWTFATEGAGLDSVKIGFDRTSISSSPAIAGGAVVFGSRDGHLYAVEAASGRQRWRFDHQVSWVVSSPAVAGGRVYAGSSDGHFFQAVDLATGREVWRCNLDERVFASPALAQGAVYFAGRDHQLYALDAATGAERWRFRTGEQVHSSPVPADGVVYLGSDDGRLYALAVPTGRGGRPLHRAVFWDDGSKWDYFKRGGRAARDAFRDRGYQVLGAAALGQFLEARIADREPSVVVFASDVAPERGAGDAERLRRYLDAGGKIVWLGFPPLLLTLDPKTGEPVAMDQERPRRVLGLDFEGTRGDEYGAWATAEGARWGLPATWMGSRAMPPAAGLTVLALDENGRAAAWVKSYGGPAGTGLVWAWGRDVVPTDAELEALVRVAEHGL